MKKSISSSGAPAATGPFSQAVTDGSLIFTSGQIYLTTEGKLLEGTVEEQIHQVLKNLQAILTEAEVSFAEVMKTTVYVTDMSLYGKVNEIYGTYFSAPFPAREVVCVKELPLGAWLEMSMVAIKK